MNRQPAPQIALADFVVIPADQLRQLVTDAVTVALRNADPTPPAPADQQPDQLMTRHQAAAFLNVSLSTVDNYIRDGLLHKKRVGIRFVRLERSEVETLARTVQ